MVGIVLVVYKGVEDTLRYVREELPRYTGPAATVVVDLASTPGETARLAARCGGTLAADGAPAGGSLLFLSTPENLGYARGNNLGARFLLARWPQIRWLLFSNTDVEWVTPGLVEGMVEALESRPDAACVGPRVLGPDGSEQLPFVRPVPARAAMWRNAVYPFRRGRPGGERAYQAAPGALAPQYCYWVSGCFFLARAADFVGAGMFDEATFLYGEEAILSERLARLGKRFLYEPRLVVRHRCGGSTSRYLQTLELTRAELDSSLHYYRAYRGLSGPGAVLFRLCAIPRLLWVRLAGAAAVRRRRRGTAPR